MTTHPHSNQTKQNPRPMRWPWQLGLLPALLLSGMTTARAAQYVPTPEQNYQLALEARTTRDYPAMVDLLRQAASAGNLAAQEMLGATLLAGSALYGDDLDGDACEAMHWARSAAAQGSAAGRHQLIVLNGLRGLPADKRPCMTPAR